MRILKEMEWVDALLDPMTRISAGGFGFPVRFSPPAAWDTGVQRISEHLMYFVVSGNCRGVVGGKKHTLEAGDFCWVCPGVEFRFFPGASSKPPGLFRFRMSVNRDRTILRPNWKVRIVRNASETIEHARSLLAAQTAAGRYAARRIAGSAVLFSISAFEESRRIPDEKGLPAGIRKFVKRHVLEHPEDRISPAALARLAGLSPDYFSRMFRMSFGVPPRAWLLKQRLHHAAGLLCEPGWRISEVAARMGYPDLYLFSRQFKKEFGASPRAWKQSHEIDEGEGGATRSAARQSD